MPSFCFSLSLRIICNPKIWHKLSHLCNNPRFLRVIAEFITRAASWSSYTLWQSWVANHWQQTLTTNHPNVQQSPLRAWTGPGGCRRLGLPDFKTIIIIIIYLFIAIGLSPGGSGYFTCIQNIKLVTNKFKSGGLHEKHVVATWTLGNRLSTWRW